MSFVPEHADTVLILANPKAGYRATAPLAERLAAVLDRAGQRASVIESPPRLAEEAAAAAAAGRLRAVVAVGGDGTAALAANLTSPETPLAVLPAGTENLLARYLHCSPAPEAAAEVILGGAAVRLDAGLANGRLFLLMAGVGFDAEVVRRLHAARTGHIHHLSYLKPILQSLRSYSYPELRVYCQPAGDDAMEVAPRAARWTFVVNMPQYAGGLRIAPQARPADGLLEACTFRQGTWFHGVRYLLGVLSGRHQRWSDFQTTSCVRVRIETDSAVPVPYHLDGDPGGMLPLEIEVLPGRLRLLAPRARIEQLESP